MISAFILRHWRIYICIMHPAQPEPQLLKGSLLKSPSVIVQLVDLFLIEMTNWRWSWRSMVITAMLAPLLSIMALGVFARDSGVETLGYVLTGNVVLALMFGNMGSVESHFVFMRSAGTLDYFATLPVRRYLLILAVVMAFFLLSLPSVLVTIILGALYLKLPLIFNPLVLLVIPIATIPLSGIGALIGTSARNLQEAGSLNLVITLAMMALGPIIIPPERLAPVLHYLGYFSPATYAASALRQTLIGPMTGRLLVDLLVLIGLSCFSFWLVGRKLDWRQR
jgi:ABC-2 type transport system permease protein